MIMCSVLVVLGGLLLPAALGADLFGVPVKIESYANEPNTGDGSYSFSFRGSDGTSRSERGEVRTSRGGVPYVHVKGTYTYLQDDGKEITVSYESGEDGYKESRMRGFELRIAPAALGSLVGGGLG